MCGQGIFRALSGLMIPGLTSPTVRPTIWGLMAIPTTVKTDNLIVVLFTPGVVIPISGVLSALVFPPILIVGLSSLKFIVISPAMRGVVVAPSGVIVVVTPIGVVIVTIVPVSIGL